MIVKEQKKQHSTTRKNINFASVANNLALVEKLVDDVCEKYKVNKDHYGNILVSITEAVNNAIQHGNKYNPDKRVQITFETGINMLYFSIEDEGDGFDYTSISDPTDPKNLEKLNGRGIFLMKNLADNVEFSENGKKVELDFKISAN